jgi:hypothetical protein
MVSVGYGDITPKNSIEMISSIGIIVLGCMFFSYSVGEISSIFNEVFEKNREISKKLEIINKYMRNKTISQKIQN